MSTFADTPRWPQHGTVWGHLISDTSLAELHEVAARAGLPPRAFDLDHYDWPEQRLEDLRAAGVQLVGNRELTRRLIASGLRIPLVARPAARRRRSEQAAAALGLSEVPADLIDGPYGHVQPLPTAPPVGSFRLTSTSADGAVHVEARDEAGRAAARRFLERAEVRARERGETGWTGQVLQLRDPASVPGRRGRSHPPRGSSSG